jgi:hypothetical protein
VIGIFISGHPLQKITLLLFFTRLSLAQDHFCESGRFGCRRYPSYDVLLCMIKTFEGHEKSSRREGIPYGCSKNLKW